MYIKNNKSFIRHTKFETNKIEAIWIEIVLPHIKNMLFCVLYRPPDSKAEWIDYFHEMLATPCNSPNDIVIIGDFNINLLDGNNRIWLQDIETHNLKQIIKVPTRETDLSSTLIDHIYTNNDGRIFNIDVPKIRLSDHYPIYFTWKHAASHRPTSKKEGHVTMKYRATDKLN